MSQDLSVLPFSELLKLAAPGPFTNDEHYIHSKDIFFAVSGATLGTSPRANAELITRLLNHGPALVEALSNAVRCGERDGMPGNPGSIPKWAADARAVLAKLEGGK